MKKIYLFFCIIIGLSKFGFAQQEPLKSIDVDFKQAGIVQVTDDLKSKTGYRFYYDPVQFDSLKVTYKAVQKPLNVILAGIFENTTYHFVITDQQEVILTRNWQINNDLVVSAFNGKPLQTPTPGEVSPGNNYFEEPKKVASASSENKLYSIGIPGNIKRGKATLAGYIRNVNSGEAIIGASIYEPVTHVGATTNQFGYYSISLAAGQYTLLIKAASMKDTRRQIALKGSGELNIEMREQIISLKEVKISTEKVANVRNVEMGVSKLDIKSIKQIPALFGEADVLRVVLTLPGVQTVGEVQYRF